MELRGKKKYAGKRKDIKGGGGKQGGCCHLFFNMKEGEMKRRRAVKDEEVMG